MVHPPHVVPLTHWLLIGPLLVAAYTDQAAA